MIIKEVSARAIKDSRNEKTIEVCVNGVCASSPSGKSTGLYESKPYLKNLDNCIKFLNSFDKDIEINSFDELVKLESILKKKLKLKDVKYFGGNALYAFESAILKALAKNQKKELWQVVNAKAKNFPRPVGNAVGGGLHSEQFGKRAVFQEFLIIPKEKTFDKNVKVMKEIYNEIGKQVKSSKINDEGAWHAPWGDEQILALMERFTDSVDIGIDCAASSFYKNKLYDYGKIKRTRPAHISHVLSLIKSYGVSYVEDPVEEEDFEGFAEIRKNDRETNVAGDDLTATHYERVERAIKSRSIGAMIVKPNQNGSLIEVRDIIDLCKKHNIKTVMSHRSGETLDDGIADYAFAFQTDFVKFGIASRWREVKLERMIAIEKTLSR